MKYLFFLFFFLSLTTSKVSLANMEYDPTTDTVVVNGFNSLYKLKENDLSIIQKVPLGSDTIVVGVNSKYFMLTHNSMYLSVFSWKSPNTPLYRIGVDGKKIEDTVVNFDADRLLLSYSVGPDVRWIQKVFEISTGRYIGETHARKFSAKGSFLIDDYIANETFYVFSSVDLRLLSEIKVNFDIFEGGSPAFAVGQEKYYIFYGAPHNPNTYDHDNVAVYDLLTGSLLQNSYCGRLCRGDIHLLSNERGIILLDNSLFKFAEISYSGSDWALSYYGSRCEPNLKTMVSQDGHVLTGSDCGHIYTFDEYGNSYQKLAAHTEMTDELSFGSPGTFFSKSYDGKLIKWDIATGTILKTFEF